MAAFVCSKHVRGRAYRLILVGLLGCHLGFVLFGAAKRTPPSLGPANPLAALYLGFSGAHYSWGFFAPNIGSQFKTDFVIHMRDGRLLKQQLGSHGPNERLLREMGISATFWFGLRDEKIRRSLTASWAASMFARHPEAERVEVEVSAFYLPSMRQIREGATKRWVSIYKAEFKHNNPPLKQGMASL